MANNENLIPPKKGEVRNPKGKPKGTLNRATIAKKWLKAMESAVNPITGKDERLTQSDIITLAQIKKARKGDTHAYKALMDSGFGLPKQEIEQTNKGVIQFENVSKQFPEGN
jgi:hypothetical protein